MAVYEEMSGLVMACCSCSRKESLKLTFSCGHKICHYPCLANLRKENLSKQKEENTCPGCEETRLVEESTPLKRGKPLKDLKLDTMPTRNAPLPPSSAEHSQRIELARRLLKESEECGCKKLSVRIFCKHSSIKSKANSGSPCKGSCDVVAASAKEEHACKDEAEFSEKEQKMFDRLRVLKESEMKLPGMIEKAKVDQRKMLSNLGEEIKETAVKIRMRLNEEENDLLQELGEHSSTKSKFYLELYDAYDELLQKEHEVEAMLRKAVMKGEDEKVIAMKEVEAAIDELHNKVRRIETQSTQPLSPIRFSPSPDRGGNIVGKLMCRKPRRRSGNLKSPDTSTDKPPQHVAHDVDKKVKKGKIVKKMQEIPFNDKCVGMIWLGDQHLISIFDMLKTEDKAILIRLYTIDADDYSMSKVGKSFMVGRNLSSEKQYSIHVCNTVGPDGASILVSLGKEVFRVTVDIEGTDPKFVSKLSKLQKTVYGLAWSKEDDKWYVLFSNPWSIYLITDSVSAVHKRLLGSNWYHPYLHSFNACVVVADISKNVFKTYDMDDKDKSRQISQMDDVARPSWPAGVSSDEVNEKWLFLWKTIGGNTGNYGEWFITSHGILGDDCYIMTNGLLANGDPNIIAFRNGRLAILYHCGKMCLYKTG